MSVEPSAEKEISHAECVALLESWDGEVSVSVQTKFRGEGWPVVAFAGTLGQMPRDPQSPQRDDDRSFSVTAAGDPPSVFEVPSGATYVHRPPELRHGFAGQEVGLIEAVDIRYDAAEVSVLKLLPSAS